jgi:hypothetical protein
MGAGSGPDSESEAWPGLSLPVAVPRQTGIYDCQLENRYVSHINCHCDCDFGKPEKTGPECLRVQCQQVPVFVSLPVLRP